MSKIFNIKKLPMDFGRLISFPFLIFFRIKKYANGDLKKNKRIKGGAIVVSNHCGFADPLAIAATFWNRRMFYIMAKEVTNNKISKFFMHGIGCIDIDRSEFDLACIKKSIKVLKEGSLLCMFPQGRIVRDETHNDNTDIKSGAILIAMQAHVPIIPLHIEYRSHWYQRQKVVIGEPFICEDFCKNKFPSPDDISYLTELLLEKSIECKNVLN